MRKLKRKVKKRLYAFLLLIIIIGCTLTYNIFFNNKLENTVTIESGKTKLEVSQFLINKKTKAVFVTDISKIDLKIPGQYKVEIQIGRKVYASQVKVVDTIAPVAEAVSQEIWANKEKKAQDFVKNIVDTTAVNVSFKEKPDFSKSGVQEVFLTLEDTSGNKSDLKSSLTVKEDTEAPKIDGAQDQLVYIGNSVSYKKAVKVTDNSGEKVNLEIDSGAVNLKQAGEYNVIYKATDSSGNISNKLIKLTVKKKPSNYVEKEVVDELADSILSSILKDGMTLREKARAIYDYTRSHISYINHSDKSDWVIAAYQGMKTNRGDCFVFFATAQELLTRAGIENQEIIKIDEGHYWSLVNLGEGWYHYDTTPRITGSEFFMLTDAQITAYSKKNRNSHVWDTSKYPATPLK
ncbi:MAG: transglutaminase domain-containing protein [Ruminiclostridium sp.]